MTAVLTDPPRLCPKCTCSWTWSALGGGGCGVFAFVVLVLLFVVICGTAGRGATKVNWMLHPGACDV